MDKTLMLLVRRRLRYRRDFTVLKLSIAWMRIRLWFMELDVSILIALKRIVDKLGGAE